MKKKNKFPKSEKKMHSTAQNDDTLTGIISATAAGFGFFKEDVENPNQHPDEVFIPSKYMSNAMDGDRVKIIILPPRPGTDDALKGPAGKIVEIVERKHKKLVAEVLPGNYVRPLNRKINFDFSIAKGFKNKAKNGEWVEVELAHSNSFRDVSAKVVRTIGQSGTIQGDLDAVVAEYGLSAPYTDEENAAAAAIIPREIEREDFTAEWTVTIDPVDAKDYDDAISMKIPRGGKIAEIGVHIADVAAYISPKSEFDKAAFKRGFTAYLPGRTLPMLPKDLTAKISLRENEISLAHSVILKVDLKNGKIIEGRRCHTLIKVDRRLDYDTVQSFIDDPKKLPDNWNKTFAGKIAKLIDCTQKMRHHRQQIEKFIDLPIPEVRVLCDENADKINGLAVKEQRPADFAVEECMLAANSWIGEMLTEKNIPGLFRVHPLPDAEKILDFSEMMAATFGFYPGDLTSREACNAFIEKLPDDDKKPVILSLFLRSLPRAFYQEKPDLHFGLGKGRYTHFTSPIRRYTDLAVHQQLWNFDTNQRLKPKDSFAKLGLDLSEKEENNDNAYYAASDRLKLRYLQELLEKGSLNFYEGIISKITAVGLTVDIAELGFSGFVRIDDLPGVFYKTTEGLRSERGNKRFKIGDYIPLRLYEVDFARGAAYFKLSN
ncbi:MAG: RNB domain-containing ribonuclease [Lentisphaeria bacterium]|nr:RNB domain-containing ribonuclease [Lentisphaeria bacterium]